MSITGKDIGLLLAGAILGGVITVAVDILWVNSSELDARALIEEKTSAQTSLAALQNESIRLGGEIAELKKKLDIEAQNKENIKNALNAEKLSTAQITEENLSLKRTLSSLEKRLSDAVQQTKTTENDMEKIRSEITNLANALDILDLLYARVTDCASFFDSFESLPEAIVELGEDTVLENLRCAKNSLRGFVRAQETFSGPIASSYNGRIRELAEIGEIDSATLFSELGSIVREQGQRRKQIIIALDELYQSIAGN